MYNIISHGAANINEVSFTLMYTPTLVNVILPTTLMQVPNDYNENTLLIIGVGMESMSYMWLLFGFCVALVRA